MRAADLTHREQVTQYTLSLLPMDHEDAPTFWITVEWRGGDRWAVKHMSSCLSRGGQWAREPMPSGRTEEWLASHRFDLETALTFARHQLPQITINGHTAADVIRLDAEREAR